MTGEIWKIVPSSPWFMASSEGRVMVIPYEAEMPHGGKRQYGGHPHFGVWNKQDARFITVHKGKTYKVAKLVCEAFNGQKPFPEAVCMHDDENSANNRCDNLAWGTQQENLNAPLYKAATRKRPMSVSCRHCSKSFEPRSVNQAFCSIKCSGTYNNKRRSANAEARI